jgi:CBS domain-containing protein
LKTIKQLIGANSRIPVAVSPDDTVISALKVMADQGIGAVLAMEGDKLAGIFSERDYARKVVLVGRNSTDTKVREVMTDKVLYVTLEQTVDQAMAMMSEKRVRHLPVLDEHLKVLAMISVGDLVKDIISEQAFQIQQLERYIAG